MKKLDIEICMGSSCFSRGNRETLEIIETLSHLNKIDCEISLKGCLCKECCSLGPIVRINDDKYEAVHPSYIKDLLEKHMG